MWTGIKKDGSGEWKVKGSKVTKFFADWAPGEPRDLPNVDCAYLSKSAGYKLETDTCKIPRQFICMALSPNCPPGYKWIPQFGQGRSCFKRTARISSDMINGDGGRREINVPNKVCLRDKTRLATPSDQASSEALRDAYTSNVLDKNNPSGSSDTHAMLGLIKITKLDGSEAAVLVDRFVNICTSNFCQSF